MTEPFLIRPLESADLGRISTIYKTSIEELASGHYDAEQRAAWKAASENELEFASRLRAGTVLVATGERVAGFASLLGNDTLDMLYVDPLFARRGAATVLCDMLETVAHVRGADLMTAEVSDAAAGFFLKRGFLVGERHFVSRNGARLARTTMRKVLGQKGVAGGIA
ncbi:MAG: GNAT family N-acetyltransferase [Rhodobiaceae bacterium]|nr:GNAT family N-acetyltransferase [Rhodobiaceae bacterium]MCC0057478.1 GNAT family N-acetyltransferase [Rhodobiaceae bacterium]